MDKILSKDTIKNVFSALGAKTSDSNYGVALLDKTSGEPKGFMGMSDLASVLGVMQNRATPSTTNLNEIWNIGFYQIEKKDGDYTNKPVGAGDYGALVVFDAGNYTIQVWINDAIGSKMYIRGNWSYGSWYGWREIALTAQ